MVVPFTTELAITLLNDVVLIYCYGMFSLCNSNDVTDECYA